MYAETAITIEEVDRESSQSNPIILVSLLYFFLFNSYYPVSVGLNSDNLIR